MHTAMYPLVGRPGSGILLSIRMRATASQSYFQLKSQRRIMILIIDHSGEQYPLQVSINTTAGTGSEVTRFTIITDPARHTKMAIVDWCVPTHIRSRPRHLGSLQIKHLAVKSLSAMMLIVHSLTPISKGWMLASAADLSSSLDDGNCSKCNFQSAVHVIMCRPVDPVMPVMMQRSS